MDGPKSFPGKQTADQKLLSLFRMDGWMIELIGFKLLVKGRDIRRISNVERHMFQTVGATWQKALLAKTFGKRAEKLEVILRAGAGRGSLESKMLT